MPYKLTELPPMLGRNTEENVAALRAYLIRLVNSLSDVEAAPVSSAGSLQVDGTGKKVIVPAGSGATGKDIEAVRKNAKDLQLLIVKTASDLGANITDGDSYVMSYTNAQIDGLNAEIHETYVAQSEFGTFVEGVDQRIETTARETVESFGYTALIQSAQNSADQANQLIQNYTNIVNGQIRRGIVLDPDTGQYVTGIAISQNLQFTGEVTTGTDGFDYYYLETGQTFGLYTSTGWQFWIDGFKKGWYNSLDGMLHISNVYIEQTLQFGTTAQFVVDASGRFGLKHIRST